jgi:hypothetical protein
MPALLFREAGIVASGRRCAPRMRIEDAHRGLKIAVGVQQPMVVDDATVRGESSHRDAVPLGRGGGLVGGTGPQLASAPVPTAQPKTPDALAPTDAGEQAEENGARAERKHTFLPARMKRLVDAVKEGEDLEVESAVLELSRSRRLFAPLAFVVSAFVMLYEGLRLLVSNWRLTLVQVLPAMWIWFALLDIKLHLLKGRTAYVVTGPVLIPIVLAIMAITTACFFLNAVFAFAIFQPGKPAIRPAFVSARAHLGPVIAWGMVIGFWLALSATVFTRWGRWWFVVSMSVVVGVMMFAYVALPSRMVGLKTTYAGYSRRDKLSAAAVGGLIGAIVCTPPYLLGRAGLLMLGSRLLFVPGILILTLGLTLQAGATGAVKAIKMSAKLAAGRAPVMPGADSGARAGPAAAG